MAEVDRYARCTVLGMPTIKKLEPEVKLRTIRVQPDTTPDYGFEEASTADIVRRAIEETKELVRIEVEIAKSEASLEIQRAKRAAIGFSIALAAGVLVLCMVAVAIVIAMGDTAGAAIALAFIFLIIGGIAAYLGYSVLPKKPFGHVRNRLQSDVRQLKERVA